MDPSFWCCYFGSANFFMHGSWRLHRFSCGGWLSVSSTRIGFFFFLQVGDTGSQPTRFPHLYLALGSVNFLWILKAFIFLDPHLLFMRIRSLLNDQNIYLLNTSTMCHSTRSRRRRRVATPATTPTRPTWRRRGRRRTTTPSRPTRIPRWIRTRPNSRRGPPLLQNLDDCLAPWYNTPFRLNIPLLLDWLLLF